MNIPKFRPIIDTTEISHCLVGKYLANLLYPLTTDEFSLKDFLMQPTELKPYIISFRKCYQYGSFDVEPLFTNVSIKRTVDIILRRIYQDRVISINLKKTDLEGTYLRHMYQNCLLVQQQVLTTKRWC